MSEDAESAGAEGFAAFARRVAEDPALTARLRPIDDPAALVAAAVAEGAGHGFRFTAAEVEAAMHENRHGFVMHPAPILPYPVTAFARRERGA